MVSVVNLESFVTESVQVTPTASSWFTNAVKASGGFGQSSLFKKNGSTTAVTLELGISNNWVRWYQPIPLFTIPHPTTTTSTVLSPTLLTTLSLMFVLKLK